MTIICGDCLDEMRKIEDNSISGIVTDPPYGLSFMGKGWDHEVPGPTYWNECRRVMAPGSFLIAMGGTRTFHRLTCAIEDAGLEIRDCISWLYGSGFPKSHNHFGLPGFGTALKPAWEPCIVAMKKCDGTFKQNAEKWGQAGLNIDGCRIETGEKLSIDAGTVGYGRGYNNYQPPEQNPKGRWPANVILDEEAGMMLDEQSGFLQSGSMKPQLHQKKNKIYSKFSQASPLGQMSSSGGASRFFYCAKASSSERNEGLDKNNHPTVKPLKLMEYLIKLIMPPKDGILLDPFAGSGTTILAAHKLGIKCIGIEKQQEYCDIANARLAYHIQNNLKLG
jgi:site-specific DNA-methyltransferase (adenine-specific)